MASAKNLKYPVNPAVLDTEQASIYLGGKPSARTLEKWRSNGSGKGPRWVDLDGIVGYRIRDLEEYLDAKTRHPEDAA